MPEQVEAELARVCSSKHFLNAPQLVKFLKYSVSCTLNNEPDRLKEYTIGLEVMKRRGDFNPKEDTIVRTDANRLRSKLDAYYQAEGRDAALRIDMPKGGYSAVFVVPRDDHPISPASAPSKAPIPIPSMAPAPQVRPDRVLIL